MLLALFISGSAASEEPRPRFKLSTTVNPSVKVRKRASVAGTTLTVGADYDIKERSAVRPALPATRVCHLPHARGGVAEL